MSTDSPAKAVVLAAGRGTRMRRPVAGVRLTAEQRRVAEAGLKGLIPFHGHPFLSYVISALADAGFREVCFVVGPGAGPIRSLYEGMRTERVRIRFAVQSEPLGSAHALLSAEAFAAGDPVAVINSDNYYPARALEKLHQLGGSGLVGFRGEALVARGNIPPERIAAYALVTTDEAGELVRIVEKPGPEERRRLEGRSWVSMTCWRFGPAIFEACRAVEPSARGELELPDAVAYARERLGERFRVVEASEPVLDLSNQGDIPSVEEHLRGITVRL